jgi:heme/copper-type cytochrome/quinol oxidase subunit 2
MGVPFRAAPRSLAILAGAASFFITGATPQGLAGLQEQAPTRREFSIQARNFTYTPSRIEVGRDDIVKIRFHAEDNPHAFTIDAYRISKRAAAGQTVVFEFRADRPGTFVYYSNLTSDERYRDMRGELVVR